MEKSAITDTQYKAIATGASRADVVTALGEPSNEQDMNIDMADLGGGEYNDACIYYNGVGDITAMYQFCFENDRLNSRARY